ncbi:MAG: WecB/TagA/CpsF family glycosyltransferase [bacterium]
MNTSPSSDPRRILVAGYYGFGNFGDQWLLSKTLDLIAHVWPGSEVQVLYPKLRQDAPKPPFVTVDRFNFWSCLGAIRQVDCLVFGGGSLFQSRSSFRSLLYYLALVFLARVFCKPCLLLAQGFGPLSRWQCWLCRCVLSQARFSYRDQASKDLVGREGDVLCDLTLWKQPSKTLSNDSSAIGLLIQRHDVLETQYSFWIEALVPLYTQVYLVASCPRDQILRDTLLKKYPHLQSFYLDDPQKAPPFRCLISSRYHACLWAAIHGASVLGIDIDPKLRHLSDDLGFSCVSPDTSASQLLACLSPSFHRFLSLKDSLKKSRDWPQVLQNRCLPRDVDFAGFRLCQRSYPQLIHWMSTALAGSQVTTIFSLNPEIWVSLCKHPERQSLFASADCLLADGIGLGIAQRFWGLGNIQKRSGSELIFACLEAARFPIYLFGGKAGVASLAQKALGKHYPQQRCLGASHGYLSENEWPRLCDHVLSLEPCLLLCGLGHPKQEAFLALLKERAKAKGSRSAVLALACGGMIDVLAGKKPFAPVWLRRCGLEWLFSAIMQPKRFLRWSWMFTFLLLVFKQRRHLKTNRL